MESVLRCLVSLAALTAAPLAAQDEPSPQQIEAATRYALPHLFEGFRATCADTLSARGYVATQGDRLQTKFAQGADAYWPDAKAALIQMASQRSGGRASEFDVFADLPDENLKPFVDGIVFTLVASELEPAMCGDIERGLALLDPMPVENIAGLVGFVVEIAMKDKNTTGDASRARP